MTEPQKQYQSHPGDISRQDIIDEVTKLRDSIDRWRVKIETKQDIHHATIFGNGKPGIDEEIRNIKASQDTLIRLAWIVVSTVVTIGVSGTIAAIIHLIRIMPSP